MRETDPSHDGRDGDARTPGEMVLREIEAFPREVGTLRATPDVTPQEIRDHLARYDFAAPVSMPDALADVMRMMREWNLLVTHPRHFGLFNPTVHDASVWADALAAVYNVQVGGWSHSPAGNEIEKHVLRYLLRSLGVDPDGWGMHFTTGGNEANHTAVVAALAARFPGMAARGLAETASRPTIYVSSETHHSFVKVARITGLGEESLHVVPATDALQMDMAALARRIIADRDSGLLPLMVVGTAGTTGAGAIDPLHALADLSREHDMWFHVDAAWGGTAALSPSLRRHLAGIERADSVTWDAHKWMSVSMGAGMFFCRHPEPLRALLNVDASYVPTRAEEVEDLYATTIQWSRRFIGLKVFLTLATLGAERMAAHIEHPAAMADHLRKQLTSRGWRVVNDSPFPLVCFTHDRIRSGQTTTAKVVDAVRAGGQAWLSDVVVRRERVLRACVTSYRTTEQDVDVLVSELERALAGAQR